MKDRKQELLDELARIIAWEKEQERLKDSVVKVGMVQKDIWYIERDKEILQGFYTIPEVMGTRLFKTGDIVILMNVDGEYFWYPKKIELSGYNTSEFIGVPENMISEEDIIS